jgi:hypothetical protein
MIQIPIVILILGIFSTFFIGLCAGIYVMTGILEARGEPGWKNNTGGN